MLKRLVLIKKNSHDKIKDYHISKPSYLDTVQ